MSTARPAGKALVLLAVFGLTLNLVAQGERKPPEVRRRLDVIVTRMKDLHFCKSGGCIYRNIQYTLNPDKARPGTYEALLKADIERRSQTYDQARYRFFFQEKTGWQLLGGSESTDINETVYERDRYESNSVYNRKTNAGLVSELPTGYNQLYFQVLNKGLERP
ncbi:hypothetical protein [Anthocerotibacter panamensis]|uniref:hypothetical protein n=1 Tax=Anthocerotibacter panamensis TaxID=2857077 RepID=UPI001C402433|nr:hypothetical protein [Anthocerotibacter panamensis]